MNISTCYSYSFLVVSGLRFHETALVISIEFFHGRTDMSVVSYGLHAVKIRYLVICDGLEEKRKTLTKRATATIVRSSTKDEHQPENNMLDKCVMKNLLAEETRLQMAGSQEHLCSYPTTEPQPFLAGGQSESWTVVSGAWVSTTGASVSGAGASVTGSVTGSVGASVGASVSDGGSS